MLGENAESPTNVDVGIITVLRDFELPAVKRAFGIYPKSPSKQVGDREYWFAKIGSEESTMNIAITVTDTQGNDNARTVTGNLIEWLNPKIVMLIGIAAGVKDKVSRGDIVVSNAVYFYEPAKLTQNRKQPRPRVASASDSLLRHFRTFSDRAPYSGWHEAFHIAEGKLKSEGLSNPSEYIHPTPHIGLIASGEKIFADSGLKEMQRVEHGDICAGETEGWGFAQAAEEAQKDWIVIRGISDFGDPETKEGIDKDRYHHSAANAAATYARKFLEQTDFKGEPKSEVSPWAEKRKPKPDEPIETPPYQPAKEPVALAVSAIIFHKTSNPLRILFCWSKTQDHFILPGGHFYKRVGDTNEKIPAWFVNPDTRPADFLLEEKLKNKYEIVAHLDGDFHHECEDIRGFARIEPTPFLNLFEKPSYEDGHVWHFDFYYMCKIDSPKDSSLEANPRFKWCSLQDVDQMVKEKRTFTNLREVTKVAMDEKAGRAITDRREEEV